MRLGRGFVCPGSKNAPVGRFEAFRGMGQRPMSTFPQAVPNARGALSPAPYAHQWPPSRGLFFALAEPSLRA